jgi:hypothetical protein
VEKPEGKWWWNGSGTSPPIGVVSKTGKGERTCNLTLSTYEEGGVLHNPIGYMVSGTNRNFLFNQPLSSEVLLGYNKFIKTF